MHDLSSFSACFSTIDDVVVETVILRIDMLLGPSLFRQSIIALRISPPYACINSCHLGYAGWVKKKKWNEIMGGGLYFKSKKNLEKIMPILSRSWIYFTFAMVKELGWLIKAFQRYMCLFQSDGIKTFLSKFCPNTEWISWFCKLYQQNHEIHSAFGQKCFYAIQLK